MDKKSFLQVLIGLLLAVIVFCAVYFPTQSCNKDGNGNSSRKSRPISEVSGEWDSNFIEDPFSDSYDN